ncbi:MAG: Methionine aminopeptidase [Candidatus Magasanikbacteria bacterium GW2011_GWC2_40_17]|uniref:Methionine aminopeptidase n=1 Tax=Candidatus Magasanikbacteria bacterium GW2011_GWA2_42_32 TaxID=1619039 RepID=A0A0G1A6W9_9BACT|nr:MAG: Methionine aminopeptidase [Candidatus Magasanikbacteria bacterium GW2011_GWC2_40_17]KKS56782.1 MAG: Methionine aminopeptidase [Candidatus Magasanikbacteria bacterium GW2011_GWA2_42_32]OGH86031.1 MAG: type I methionyl aminopeptidase [Candidatus Magasanikbacteria bacterium RIFOXYB2_FULL_38_10]
MSNEFIAIKSPEEIEKIKEGGCLLGNILRDLGKMVKPGISTADLEKKAEELILKVGGRPAFKYYHERGEIPFPTILCTSVNDEVVHVPSVPGKILQNGDIIGIDIGMEYPAVNGFFTDTAITVAVGKISKDVAKLMEVTRKALFIGIKEVKPGSKISEIGKAIEHYVSRFGFGIVRDLVGHGVGYAVHEEPRIPNYYDRALDKIEIKEGMVLAIEPMINLGSWKVKEGDDGFAIKTADGSFSAHFEHTVVVTKNGCEIVT